MRLADGEDSDEDEEEYSNYSNSFGQSSPSQYLQQPEYVPAVFISETSLHDIFSR